MGRQIVCCAKGVAFSRSCAAFGGVLFFQQIADFRQQKRFCGGSGFFRLGSGFCFSGGFIRLSGQLFLQFLAEALLHGMQL